MWGGGGGLTMFSPPRMMMSLTEKRERKRKSDGARDGSGGGGRYARRTSVPDVHETLLVDQAQIARLEPAVFRQNLQRNANATRMHVD
jgi:hypothetical protein